MSMQVYIYVGPYVTTTREDTPDAYDLVEDMNEAFLLEEFEDAALNGLVFWIPNRAYDQSREFEFSRDSRPGVVDVDIEAELSRFKSEFAAELKQIPNSKVNWGVITYGM